MDTTLRSFAPEPHRVAAETWVIPEVFTAAPGTFVPINSMVIAGAEPVIVDTGTALNRQRWIDAVFSIVDPVDVRWVFLSHDDHDHVGNLVPVLELCPHATLVTTWFMVERLRGDHDLPLERMRWVNDGESFDAGDRTLVALTPPVFDSPTTRGLFDATSGVYWAADTFASLIPDWRLRDVGEMDHAFWHETMLANNRMISPWHGLTDEVRFNRHVDRVATLPVTTIASAHSGTITGPAVAEAFSLIRQLPRLEQAPLPTQSDLDAIVAQLAVAATAS